MFEAPGTTTEGPKLFPLMVSVWPPAGLQLAVVCNATLLVQPCTLLIVGAVFV